MQIRLTRTANESRTGHMKIVRVPPTVHAVSRLSPHIPAVATSVESQPGPGAAIRERGPGRLYFSSTSAKSAVEDQALIQGREPGGEGPSASASSGRIRASALRLRGGSVLAGRRYRG
jgi:hypothetical protein